MNVTQNTVGYSEARTMIHLAIEDRIPLLILGNPGIGKTSLVRQVAAKLDIQSTEQLGYLYEPVDFRGLMVPDESTSTTRSYSLGKWPLKRLVDSGIFEKRGVLLLDEMLNSHRDVLTAFAEPLLDHAVNGEPLGEQWSIIATGNHLGGNTSANALPSHVANRVTIINIIPSWDEWVGWATGVVRPELIAYFQMTKGDDLFRYEPSKLTPNQPYLTPRSLENLSRRLNTWDRVYPHRKPPVSLYSSIVGEYGGKLYATLDYIHQLVTWQEIEANPSGCRLPDHLQAIYTQLQIMMAALKAAGKTIKRPMASAAMTYLKRFGRPEIEAVAMHNWVAHTAFSGTPECAEWVSKNQHLI
jgi:hypothetical protein